MSEADGGASPPDKNAGVGRPLNPYAVMAAGALLPGSGHVWLGLPHRGLAFLFFMLMLGWVSTHLAAPNASFIGRHAGGFLVYAFSVLDAYRIARIRFETWRMGVGRGSTDPGES